jgi:hypothetical protein
MEARSKQRTIGVTRGWDAVEAADMRRPRREQIRAATMSGCPVRATYRAASAEMQVRRLPAARRAGAPTTAI